MSHAGMAILAQIVEGISAAPPGGSLSLVIPRGWKRPKGFPRGELLCDGAQGPVYRIDADRLNNWLWRNCGLRVAR